MRRIQLGDLPGQTYDSLEKEVALLAGPDAGNYVRLTYEDVDKHTVKIGSTRELVYAVQDCADAGFVMISAAVQKEAFTGTYIATPPTSVAAFAPVTPVKIEGQCSQTRKRKKPSPAAKRATGGKRKTPVSKVTVKPRSTGGRKLKPSMKKLEAEESEAVLEAALATLPDNIGDELPVTTAVAPTPDVATSCTNNGVTDGATRTPPAKKAKTGSVRDKICDSLMELRALHIMSPPRIQVALFAGYSNVKSAGFVKVCSQLKKEGLIEYPTKKTIQCSEAGAKQLPAVDPPIDNAAVQARLRVLLKGKNKGKVGSSKTDQVFEVLSDGKVYPRQIVASALGYTNLKSAGFVKALSTLSGLGLAIYPDNTSVQLTDIAFPYGRPGQEEPSTSSSA